MDGICGIFYCGDIETSSLPCAELAVTFGAGSDNLNG